MSLDSKETNHQAEDRVSPGFAWDFGVLSSFEYLNEKDIALRRPNGYL